MAPKDAGLPAWVNSPNEIIVGSDRGLETWLLDGSGMRTVSFGIAYHPRFLDDRSVVALVYHDDDLAKGGWLDCISLIDGKRSKLATLPPFAYKPPSDGTSTFNPEYFRLNLQDSRDFRINRTKQQACLSLLNRNINVATFAVDILIDLKSGQVSRWLSMGEEDCLPPTGVKIADQTSKLDCPVEKIKAPNNSSSFPFSFNSDNKIGVVSKDSDGVKTPVLEIPGYASHPSGLSPSGRWLVLA